MGEDDKPSVGWAVRASDGVTVKEVRDFGSLYARPTSRLVGRTLLLQESQPTGGILLRQYDIRTGQDLWSEALPSGFVQAKTEDPNLVAVFNQTEGKLRVFDLQQKKEILAGNMLTEHLVGVRDLTVLRDANFVYVAINGPGDGTAVGPVQSNLLSNTGLRSVPVNGELYAFDLKTGKTAWRNPALNQAISLEQFEDLPLILMTSRYNWRPKGSVGPVGNPQMHLVTARSVNKLNGKMIYDNDSNPDPSTRRNSKFPPLRQQYFHAVNANPHTGRIEFIGPELKIVHQMEPEGTK
jgi:hypothetical protein